MTRRHSIASTMPTVLLIVLLLRLALGLIGLVLRLAVWILLRLCWLVEAAVDHLTTRATMRPGAVVEQPVLRLNAPPPPPPPANVGMSSGIKSGGFHNHRPVPPAPPPSHNPNRAVSDSDDVARLCKVLGRNDPETRRMAEAMLASGTRVKVS